MAVPRRASFRRGRGSGSSTSCRASPSSSSASWPRRARRWPDWGQAHERASEAGRSPARAGDATPEASAASRLGARPAQRESGSTMTDVLYEEREATALVTMNRPQYRNAQNAKMTFALDEAFVRAASDDAVKVIVLGGAGDHFSAGHDIGTPERDIHKDFPRVATTWWPHEDKPGAENL